MSLKIMTCSEPLVSIIVITYNSAKYVLETLESALAQTYRNIELIVSDDCSTDNTVHLVSKWLRTQQGRFLRTVLLTSTSNTGVTLNCQRGVDAAHGRWIKFIAGDDILSDQCVNDFISFLGQHPEAKFLFGSVVPFAGETVYKPILAPREFIQGCPRRQLRLLLKKGNCILGPASFINRETLISIGGLDRRIAMQEDFPLWLRATSAGIRLFFMEAICAYYRLHGDSLTGSVFLGNCADERFRRSACDTQQKVVNPLLLHEGLVFTYWHSLLRSKRNEWLGGSRWFRLSKVLHVFDPVGILRKLCDVLRIEYAYHFRYIPTREKLLSEQGTLSMRVPLI